MTSGHPKSKLSVSDCVCREWEMEREPVELWSIPRSLVATSLVRSNFSHFWESISICVLIAFEISTKSLQGKGQ